MDTGGHFVNKKNRRHNLMISLLTFQVSLEYKYFKYGSWEQS